MGRRGPGKRRREPDDGPARRAKGAVAMPRIVDILIAALALALLSPVLLIAVVAIRLGSRGPAIYRQRRVGLGGGEFEMLKLRTMVQGSDPVGVGTVVGREDPRVTAAGRLLRRT